MSVSVRARRARSYWHSLIPDLIVGRCHVLLDSDCSAPAELLVVNRHVREGAWDRARRGHAELNSWVNVAAASSSSNRRAVSRPTVRSAPMHKHSSPTLQITPNRLPRIRTSVPTGPHPTWPPPHGAWYQSPSASASPSNYAPSLTSKAVGSVWPALCMPNDAEESPPPAPTPTSLGCDGISLFT